MTPSASAEAWRPRAERRGGRRALQAAFVGVVVLIGSQYVAGCALLWSLHRDVRTATPLTVARYAYYYGERPDIRRRTVVVSGVGLGVVVAVMTLAILMPRRRSLHGEARFASRSEIRRAGLLGDHGIILGRIGGRCLMLADRKSVV